MAHRLGDDHSERGVAVVGFDCMFLTEKDLYSRSEWLECEERELDPNLVLKILVVRDMRSKSVFAHAVPVKGSDEDGYAVQCVVDDIAWLGFGNIYVSNDFY